MARFTMLAREAVGFDEARGDSVNVVNSPFHSEKPLPMEKSSWYAQTAPARACSSRALGALLVIGVLLVLVRPIVRNLLQAPSAPALPGGRVRAISMPSAHGACRRSSPCSNAWLSRAASPTEDPRRVAQVVKHWMSSDA